jgi:rhodanese-related sulfurtransferase
MNLFCRSKRLFALLLVCLAPAAWAESVSTEISAAQAQALFAQDEITLIDIRRPDEWRQTGVAAGVTRINMQHPQGLQGFAQEVFDTVGGDLDAPIVLICRTGSRTSRIQPILTQAGFTNVRHVPEGMLGNRRSPGWIAQGLPTEPCSNC